MHLSNSSEWHLLPVLNGPAVHAAVTNLHYGDWSPELLAQPCTSNSFRNLEGSVLQSQAALIDADHTKKTSRAEIYTSTHYINNFLLQNFENFRHEQFKEKLFLDLVSLEPQVAAQKQKNLDAIQWICRDTKLHYADHSPMEWYGGSRDGFHPGADQHDKILERFVRVKKSPPLPSFW